MYRYRYDLAIGFLFGNFPIEQIPSGVPLDSRPKSSWISDKLKNTMEGTFAGMAI
jgi:hypothetical protein